MSLRIVTWNINSVRLRVDQVARFVAEYAPDVLSPDGAVLIVGFGRVGRLVGELLAEHDQRFIALDAEPASVRSGRTEGHEVYYGDAARPEMLTACGLESARALIVTMDSPTKVDDVVKTARALRG